MHDYYLFGFFLMDFVQLAVALIVYAIATALVILVYGYLGLFIHFAVTNGYRLVRGRL